MENDNIYYEYQQQKLNNFYKNDIINKKEKFYNERNEQIRRDNERIQELNNYAKQQENEEKERKLILKKLQYNDLKFSQKLDELKRQKERLERKIPSNNSLNINNDNNLRNIRDKFNMYYNNIERNYNNFQNYKFLNNNKIKKNLVIPKINDRNNKSMNVNYFSHINKLNGIKQSYDNNELSIDYNLNFNYINTKKNYRKNNNTQNYNNINNKFIKNFSSDNILHLNRNNKYDNNGYYGIIRDSTDITNNEIYDKNFYNKEYDDYFIKNKEYSDFNKKLMEIKNKDREINLYNKLYNEKNKLLENKNYYKNIDMNNKLLDQQKKFEYRKLLDEQVKTKAKSKLYNENFTVNQVNINPQYYKEYDSNFYNNDNSSKKERNPTPQFINKNKFVEVNPYNKKNYDLGNSYLKNNPILYPHIQYKFNKYIFPNNNNNYAFGYRSMSTSQLNPIINYHFISKND